MKKAYAIITVLSALISHHSWGMLIPSVTDRHFDSHHAMVKSFQTLTPDAFLESCFNRPLNEIPKNLCAMKKEEGIKMLFFLNTKYPLLLKLARSSDERFTVVSQLFGGNTAVATMCCNLPLNEIKRLHDTAKKMLSIYPITLNKALNLEHYALLSGNQVSMLSRTMNENVIDPTDVHKFASVIQRLHRIDPSVKVFPSTVNSIKIYPSIQERTLLFWNQPSPLTFYDIATLLAYTLCCGALGNFCYKYEYLLASETFFPSFIVGIITNSLISGKLHIKYLNYYNDLKHNVLPNQPSLDQKLQERIVSKQ